ncbi:MAG: hypothetical protein ABIR96_02890 [Bdellovibrionota bacterium]
MTAAFYQTRPETDTVFLMDLYRRIRGIPDRAESHYERHARQLGEASFFRSYIVMHEGHDVGLLEYGKHPFLEATDEAWIDLQLSPTAACDEASLRGLLDCAEEDMAHRGFLKFHMESRDPRLVPLLPLFGWVQRSFAFVKTLGQ